MTRQPAGLRLVPPPPTGSSPLEAAEYYLSGYFEEFFRVREVVKRRVSAVTWTTTLGSGFIAVLGATSAALTNEAWPRVIGIATALVSSLVTAISAWDALSKPRQHWFQQTAAVNALTRERLWLEQKKAEGADEQVLADHVFAMLDREFAKDLDRWMRTHEQEPQQPDTIRG